MNRVCTLGVICDVDNNWWVNYSKKKKMQNKFLLRIQLIPKHSVVNEIL